MQRRRSILLAFAALAALGVALTASHPRVRYVAVAATYQLELLWGRVPLDRALRDGHFTPEQVKRLELVPEIRSFARQIGLRERGHYATINPTWNRTVYNVSACEELAFRPATWWFPIVGAVPYLGYFDAASAETKAERLRSDGLDVHVRPAGAWSTLGWFRDPLLPAMADWDEARLANTLLHELTHATLWIPGSVAFNESLANFVGDEASLRYLATRHGEDSEEVALERARRADRDRYIAMMVELYAELDTLYASASSTDEKRLEKQRIYGSLPSRAMRAGFSEPERWSAWFEREPWNNARLVQFKVYNRSPEWFAAVLDQEGGDLERFLAQVAAITSGQADPYVALENAATRDAAGDATPSRR